jgi:predicted phage gp36 major capsid-like protein
VYVSGYLPTPAANAKSLVFGDFKLAYGIRRVNSVSVQRQVKSTRTAANSGSGGGAASTGAS